MPLSARLVLNLAVGVLQRRRSPRENLAKGAT